MHPLKFKCLILLLSGILIFSSGCQNIMIPPDEPMTAFTTGSDQKKATIDNCTILSAGRVQDINTENNRLLLLTATSAPPVTYNIDFLDTDRVENRLTNFINSDKDQLSAAFDSNHTGIFYVEQTNDPSGKTISQMVWTSSDKSTTRTISTTDENVNSVFHTIADNQVIYTTDDGHVVLADTSGRRDVYSSDTDIYFTDADYLSESKTFVFLGHKKETATGSDLYTATLNDNNSLSDLSLIGNNVLTFDINSDKTEVLYTQEHNNKRRIMRYSLSGESNPAVISEGNYTSAQYSDNSILCTQYSDTNNQSLQTIWLMSSDGKEASQLTPPLILASPIFNRNGQLYFSVKKDPQDPLDNTQNTSYQTLKITYTISQ